MPYPQALKELIKKVEATRPERVARKKKGEEVPFMSLDERAATLQFHPDVKEEGRRALLVGPSKGYRLAHEYADLLEAMPRVDPDKVDLSTPHIETDVLLIGGGGAGTAAAQVGQLLGDPRAGGPRAEHHQVVARIGQRPADQPLSLIHISEPTRPD
mgnify:CR=1 FL=1